MSAFAEMRLPAERSGVAPDGSDVRVMLQLSGGGLAEFQLGPGRVSRAVRHRTVEEIWFFVGGHGKMWRRQGAEERVVAVEAGVCLTVPVGTSFQFRSSPGAPLTAVAVTMPPWPGDDDVEFVDGCPDW